MADIDATDAPSGSGSTQVKQALGKSKATAGEGGSDGKKRFEVKKVGPNTVGGSYCKILEINLKHSGILYHFGRGIS
jgi:hypothetical protein